MNATDLSFLHGRVVLVCSSADHRNPPTGRRGTLFVDTDETGRQHIEAEIEFPEMYTSRAHRWRLTLSEGQVEQLLRTAHFGAYTLTLDGRLDPELTWGNE